MMFKPELCEKILDGTKTMTRRPLKDGKNPYRVGQWIAVQPGRGRKGIATVEVVDTRVEFVGDISYEDARLEGFAGEGSTTPVAAFLDYWRGLYGDDANLMEQVAVIEFKLVKVTAVICSNCHGDGTVEPEFAR